MKIISISGNEIQACVQFEVNGFCISCSSIFSPACIAVFDRDGFDCSEKIFGFSGPISCAENVSKAIQWCAAQ